MTRSQQGKFGGGHTPFGLMRDPDDRGHLIIDPDTAPVIRKIYDLALDGWSCMRIGKQLMEDRIPITRVKGAHLVCRTHQKGIRSNTYDIISRDEWEIIEGCHEAIITSEEWDIEPTDQPDCGG